MSDTNQTVDTMSEIPTKRLTPQQRHQPSSGHDDRHTSQAMDTMSDTNQTVDTMSETTVVQDDYQSGRTGVFKTRGSADVNMKTIKRLTCTCGCNHEKSPTNSLSASILTIRPGVAAEGHHKIRSHLN